MVNELVLYTSITLVIATIIIIYNRPDVIKKDHNKPLSLSNFSLKKTFIGDWKSFLIFLLLMFLVWSYAHDTKACREMMENLDEICVQYMSTQSQVWANDDYISSVNDYKFKFVGDTNGTKNTG